MDAKKDRVWKRVGFKEKENGTPGVFTLTLAGEKSDKVRQSEESVD